LKSEFELALKKTIPTDSELTLLILGGNKNGQDSDIKKARKILKKYIEN
jgi:putative component of toxin-antitoxin plasmid stabilization module